MASSSLDEHLHGGLAQDLDHALDALAVQLAADLLVEPLGASVHGDEADELLQPGHRLLGVPHQTEVQAEPAVSAGLRLRATIKVIHDDRRVAANEHRVLLEDL